MKREVKLLVLFILTGFLIVLVGQRPTETFAQNQPADTKPAQETQPEGLVWDWLNDFENCEDWRAVSTCPLGDTKIRKIEGKPIKMEGGKVTPILKPEDLDEKDKNLKHEDKYVLGVKTYFIDRGFDRVEVFPPNEYIIRGKAKEVRVWVLGRKFRHTLFMKLRDFRGNIHKIKIGRLDFWGWREMKAIIPGWLPQSTRYAMLDKNLHFVSFFVESDTYEVPGTFYFYMDNFRIRTDMSEFTGDTTIKDNW
ncbi:MAG TPA: flagellar filament outer layer protein FlaA [Spirochaetota bacterium]|nr:flagellar filament outer layer protein FlaA [Spirochaetota bacterium]HNT10007.1 flagellar filament outer layer protein FlaA [Spirochaetota bacterium]HNV47395.1 flagellar filament outer layer protein FlaA [Spirochaetota bacterium]HPU87691.1 flagellar filament outer layer protein FlaA [Spirochaetota bacterium]